MTTKKLFLDEKLGFLFLGLLTTINLICIIKINFYFLIIKFIDLFKTKLIIEM